MKYFLHDSNAFNDEKVTELYINFGYEGLGLFYTILEKIAQQEKPIKTSVLKVQLRVGKKLEKCWKFMEEIGIISSNNGDTFNKQLLKFSEKYQIKKESNRIRVANFRDKQANVTHYESVSNTPKVKESKVNISISKDIEAEPSGSEIAIKEEFGRQDINKLLEDFKTIMGFPSASNKDRIFATHLLKNFNQEQLNSMLKYCSTDEYAPRVGSLEKLWFKRGDIISGIKSKFNKINNNATVDLN